MIIQHPIALCLVKSWQFLPILWQFFHQDVKITKKFEIWNFELSKWKFMNRKWFRHTKNGYFWLHLTCRIQTWKNFWKKLCSSCPSRPIWVFETQIHKIRNFWDIQKYSFWVKGNTCQHHICKNEHIPWKNEAVATKNAKFWFFTLSGWNLKKWL